MPGWQVKEETISVGCMEWWCPENKWWGAEKYWVFRQCYLSSILRKIVFRETLDVYATYSTITTPLCSQLMIRSPEKRSKNKH